MQLTSKQKSLLIIVALILVIFLPVCYGLIKSYSVQHNAAHAVPVSNQAGK